jgi:hypothetical protein
MTDAKDEAWRNDVKRVHRQMVERIRGSVASISRTRDDRTVEAAGSGVYLKLLERIYLLSCEHVVTKGYSSGFRLAHLPRADASYHVFPHPWIKQEWPVDLALTYIDPSALENWDKVPLPLSSIAERFTPSPSELLIISGHPGAESKFRNIPGDVKLESTRVTYLARETTLPAGLNPDSHFALQYEMDLAEPTDDRKGNLPLPPGFSGSGIWDTGFVRSRHSKNWTAAEARLVGIAQRWVKEDACLICIKSERVREELLHAVREDFAYQHWVGEGRLTKSPTAADGEYALKTVPMLY